MDEGGVFKDPALEGGGVEFAVKLQAEGVGAEAKQLLGAGEAAGEQIGAGRQRDAIALPMEHQEIGRQVGEQLGPSRSTC